MFLFQKPNNKKHILTARRCVVKKKLLKAGEDLVSQTNRNMFLFTRFLFTDFKEVLLETVCLWSFLKHFFPVRTARHKTHIGNISSSQRHLICILYTTIYTAQFSAISRKIIYQLLVFPHNIHTFAHLFKLNIKYEYFSFRCILQLSASPRAGYALQLFRFRK